VRVVLLSHLASPMAPTGAERSLVTLASGLAARAHSVSVAAPGRWMLRGDLEAAGRVGSSSGASSRYGCRRPVVFATPCPISVPDCSVGGWPNARPKWFTSTACPTCGERLLRNPSACQWYGMCGR
jgi:hypothetical protein